MRARTRVGNPFKKPVIRFIRGTTVDTETIRRAYESLQPQDRDCLRHYVPRLLAIEGC